MNSYTCFYRGEQLEVEANTSAEAQEIARKQFQDHPAFARTKVKGFDIATVLLHKGREEEPVIHSPIFQ